MKSKLFFLLLLLSGFGLSAQHETLFNNARVVGGFGGPIVEFGLGSRLNTSVGGGGGIVVNSFFLGGYGLGSVDFDRLFEGGEVEVLNIGHGGFWLGGTFQPYRLLHVYGSSRIGWGVINVDLNNSPSYDDVDKIFVLTPELGFELNLTRWFRLAGTAGYRWVRGANESRGYTSEEFSGAVGTVALRFGWFGWQRN
jgi:hypothetical protein